MFSSASGSDLLTHDSPFLLGAAERAAFAAQDAGAGCRRGCVM